MVHAQQRKLWIMWFESAYSKWPSSRAIFNIGVTMKHIYFWGDTIQRWVVRLAMFGIVPIGITALYSWYYHGVTNDFLVRIKILLIYLVILLIFVAIAYLKGTRLSKRQIKNLQKNGAKSSIK